MEDNNNENVEEIKEAIAVEEKTENINENTNSKIDINTEELKKETKDTFNEVKETVKKVDIKKEGEATKNFVVDFIKNPLGKIKEIANETSNKYFVTTIFIVVLWAILIAISSIAGYTYFFKYNFGNNLLSVIKSAIAPAIGIIVMAVIVLVMNKDNKKSLITYINTITTAKIPLFLAAIVSLLRLLNLRDTSIITAFSSLCTVISTVLLYFGLKELFGEKEDDNFMKKFFIVEAIFYVAYFIISFTGIYIR